MKFYESRLNKTMKVLRNTCRSLTWSRFLVLASGFMSLSVGPLLKLLANLWCLLSTKFSLKKNRHFEYVRIKHMNIPQIRMLNSHNDFIINRSFDIYEKELNTPCQFLGQALVLNQLLFCKQKAHLHPVQKERKTK